MVTASKNKLQSITSNILKPPLGMPQIKSRVAHQEEGSRARLKTEISASKIPHGDVLCKVIRKDGVVSDIYTGEKKRNYRIGY